MNNYSEEFYVGYDRILVKVDSPVLEGYEVCKSLDDLRASTMKKTPPIVPGVRWTGAKIPNALMSQILGTIHAFPKMETAYVLYYSTRENKWAAKCPEQNGAGAAVYFKDNGEPPAPGFATIGTIHTHPEMSAFWSGIDLDDQRSKWGIHMVFGLRDGFVDTTLCTVFTLTDKYDQKLEDVIEPIDFKHEWAPNKEWVEKIKRSKENGQMQSFFTEGEREQRSKDIRRRRG